MSFDPVEDVASFLVTKHSWKGRNKRVFVIGCASIRTLNPGNLEVTNEWPLDSVVELLANARTPLEFSFVFKKRGGTDAMRFSCDWRSELIETANRVLRKPLATPAGDYSVCKLTWDGSERRVRVRLTSWGVEVVGSTTTTTTTSTYPLSRIEMVEVVDGCNLMRIVLSPFGRVHAFRFSTASQLGAFVSGLGGVVNDEIGGALVISRSPTTGRFGSSADSPSLSEFSVYKSGGTKHRLLCLTPSSVVERDPSSYLVCSLVPYADIHSLHRCPTDLRLFTITTGGAGARTYASSDRDNVLVALLDSVRASGNTAVFVHSAEFRRAMRWAPVGQTQGADVDEIHLRLLTTTTGDHLASFVFNVGGGSTAAAASETHDRLVASALACLVNADDVDKTPVRIEAEFLAIRRLLCCPAGFECFSAMPQFRERMGRAVSKAIRCNDDAAAAAAIEALNVLMQPPEAPEAADLIREQANKRFILHSTRFLECLLTRLVECVRTGTSSLVVCALLDFFTFALCAPFSETTDGAQFEHILRLTVETSGRAFFSLVDHPSLTVRKGAALILRSLIEESKGEQRQRLIELALTEAAVLSHLSTALYGPAAVTATAGGDRTFVRKLSRSLLDLWTADGVLGHVFGLLKRVFPAGLLRTLTSAAAADDNGPDFVEDCCCLENSSANADSTAARMGRDSLALLGPRDHPAVSVLMFVERHVNRALGHWRLRVNLKSDTAAAGSSGSVVLRRKRPRPSDACVLNWRAFFVCFYADHAEPDLIWNFRTRRELRDRLASEYGDFVQARSLCPPAVEVAWNADEFAVAYACLADEVRIGPYYLRILLLLTSDPRPFLEPFQFFHQLYHRFLLSEPQSPMRRMCARALGLVYGQCGDEIGWFSDVAFVTSLLDRGANADPVERDHLVDFCFHLAAQRQSAADLVPGVAALLALAPLCHLQTDRATLAAPVLQSSAIEAAAAAGHEESAEWHVQGGGGGGPFPGRRVGEMLDNGEITGRTPVWAAGMDAWRPVERVSQFYWRQGSVPQTTTTVLLLRTLIRICQHFPSRKGKAVVRPLPRIMAVLSEPMALTTLAQLTLTFDPTVVEHVATLLGLVVADNPCVSRLYSTGIFFFFLMYQGSNLRPIATLLHATHLRQAAFSSSVLSPLLPDAMIYYLENYGPDRFSDAFLGECRTPEVIWDAGLRRHLINRVAAHLYDFSPRLKSNIYAPYQYCPIPRIDYPPPLADELFCNRFYLKELCASPEWPVADPVQLLRDCLRRWIDELAVTDAALSIAEAREILGLAEGAAEEPADIRRAYFRLAQQFHPDKNPGGRDRFEQVNRAYDLLVSVRVAGPNKTFIALLMAAQTYVYRRFASLMQPFCYAGYCQLVETLERFGGDNDDLAPDALELCVATVSCCDLNAEAFRAQERGVELLRECYSRSVCLLLGGGDQTHVRICISIARFWAVAGRFQRCRDEVASCLPGELCHALRTAVDSHLTELALPTLDACDALTEPPTGRLVKEFVRNGLPLQLLRTLFNYDVTMADEDEGAAEGVSTGKQRMLNRLAVLAFKVLKRFVQYIDGCLPTHMAKMTDPVDFLNQFHANTQSPMLLWNNSCRSELLNLLEKSHPPFEADEEEEDELPINIFAQDWKYSLHQDEPVLVGVYLKHYVQKPDQIQAGIEGDLFSSLLATDDDNDRVPLEIRLQCLLTLCTRHEPDSVQLAKHLKKLVHFVNESPIIAAQIILAMCSYEACVNVLTTAPLKTGEDKQDDGEDQTASLCSALLTTLVPAADPNIHLSS